MTFSKNLKSIRILKGLTQQQLGERASMADSAIRRYESGRTNPTSRTIKRLADALGVTPSELMDDNGPSDSLIIERLERDIHSTNPANDVQKLVDDMQKRLTPTLLGEFKKK